MIGIVPSLLTLGMSEEAAQARATSSITMQVARASAPAPPYSSAMCGAAKSDAASASYDACGNSPLSSTSAAAGATLASQTARTASRIARCSSVRANRGMPSVMVRSYVGLLVGNPRVRLHLLGVVSERPPWAT